jgi:glycolate oxidase iron-sulfur subunit
MQTALSEELRATSMGRDADDILRTCVHCGFCNATCPTYQLLGDELDGPRGRIYLMKQMLEGRPVTARTRTHLDRCLTCRACETTCPSGVRYGDLVDIGRHLIERRAPRPPAQRLLRRAMRALFSHAGRFRALIRSGQILRPLLPGSLRGLVPPRAAAGPWPVARHSRRMVVLDGCVQPTLAPDINAAAARVLDRLGVSLQTAPRAGCCGALSLHLGAEGEARDFARRNIDAWWPELESGAEAIVMTASGCGVFVRDYERLLAEDPDYCGKAARISELTRDLSEVLSADALTPPGDGELGAVAFHSPCTLQHGQRITGRVEALLEACGYRLVPVPEGHLCCGSAGTYSLLQRDLSGQLLERKLRALESEAPDVIATANIGCLSHLAGGARVPVAHWVQLVDEALAGR